MLGCPVLVPRDKVDASVARKKSGLGWCPCNTSSKRTQSRFSQGCLNSALMHVVLNGDGEMHKVSSCSEMDVKFSGIQSRQVVGFKDTPQN